MARPLARTKLARTTSTKTKKAPPSGAVTLTRKHRTIVGLTRQILKLDADVSAQDAMGRIAIGGLLLEVKDRLDYGEWEAWLEQEVPYGPRTAQRYMTLHRFAQDQPGLTKQLANLGPTKLYELARLDPPRLKRLTANKRHRVARGTTLSLMQMSVEQLRALIARTAAALEQAEERRKLVQGMARSVKRIASVSQALAEHADQIEPSIALAWRDQLRKAADLLDDTFGFG